MEGWRERDACLHGLGVKKGPRREAGPSPFICYWLSRAQAPAAEVAEAAAEVAADSCRWPGSPIRPGRSASPVAAAAVAGAAAEPPRPGR